MIVKDKIDNTEYQEGANNSRRRSIDRLLAVCELSHGCGHCVLPAFVCFLKTSEITFEQLRS
jgi:hypothetical protein